jgi:hypothetical protein
MGRNRVQEGLTLFFATSRPARSTMTLPSQQRGEIALKTAY